jgi:nucleoporin NDC1
MAAATVRRSPYKDFLQPALQRRFATASLVVLAIAYLQSLLLASWTSCEFGWSNGRQGGSISLLILTPFSVFWSWFPIGPTGFRAIPLFFGGILVVILRISQYHPGLRTSNSGFQTFLDYALKWNTLETIFAYTSSAIIFGFIYLWSLDEDAGLEFVTYYTADRARLNERPLLLLSYLSLLGVYQAILHLVQDVDRLKLGAARPQNGSAAGQEDGDPSVQLRRFRDRLPSVLAYAVNHALIGMLFSTFFYPVFVRSCVWKTTLFFLRPIYNLPRSSNLPSSFPISAALLFRGLISGAMLMFAWAAANTAFSLFLAKHPLKNGKPLTSDSKDPNGSLLNGLKNKKLSIKVSVL